MTKKQLIEKIAALEKRIGVIPFEYVVDGWLRKEIDRPAQCRNSASRSGGQTPS